MSERLRNFIEKAAHDSGWGCFDDARPDRPAQLFLRAINCGAITEDEALARTSLTLAELRSGSFEVILAVRSA